MVQMKVTASILLAAAAITPVVAYGFEAEDSLITREDNEFETAFARDFDLELEERELDDDLLEREFEEDLYERARFGGGGFSGGRGMGRMMKFGGGGGFKGIRKGLGRVASAAAAPPSEAREFNDDILEREFDEELFEREDEDELLEREDEDELLVRAGDGPSTRGSGPSTRGSGPSTRGSGPSTRGSGPSTRGSGPSTRGSGPSTRGSGPSTRGSGPSTRGSGPSTRGSGPSTRGSGPSTRGSGPSTRGSGPSTRGSGPSTRGSGPSTRGSGPSTRGSGPRSREFSEELEEREIDGDELFSRDVDFELFEREPEPLFGFIKNWWNNRKGKKTPPAEDAAPDARSVDEMELLEREYYDDLD